MDNEEKIENLIDEYDLKTIESYEQDVRDGKESLTPWEEFETEIAKEKLLSRIALAEEEIATKKYEDYDSFIASLEIDI